MFSFRYNTKYIQRLLDDIKHQFRNYLQTLLVDFHKFSLDKRKLHGC